MPSNRPINIKALVLGVLTDVGGSLVIGFILGIALAIIFIVRGVQPNEIRAHLNNATFLVSSTIIGFGFTLFGGFVAGRIAKRNQILHGAIIGAIGIPLGLPFLTSLPLWCNIISVVGVIPFGILGGYIARPKQEHDEAEQGGGG
ncbi:MAG: hypothetical protein WC381_06200 [Kiritimatiellia bacterium]